MPMMNESNISKYRCITAEELEQLISESEKVIDWLKAINFMKDAYGPNAYKLIVEYTEQSYFDDENWNPSVQFKVFNRDGDRFYHKLELPLCQHVLTEYGCDTEDDVLLEFMDVNNDFYPHKSATYTTDQPPVLTHELYVKVS